MEPPLTRATAPTRSTWFSLLVGALGIALPTVGRLALDPLLEDQAPYLLHLAAVPIAAWMAGPVAGGIALAGGTLAVQILFLSPRSHFLPGSLPIASGEALFVVVGAAAVWLIGQLERKDRALRHERERLQRLVDASAQSVWLTDADGVPVADSPSWRAFTGRSFEQFVGWTWLDAVHPDDRERLAREWREAVTARTPCRPEFRLLHHSGEYRHIACSAVPILNRDGSVSEWIGMNVDVTARRRLEEQHRATAAELARANRLKDEFLATLSHELRTPLHAIVGWSSMLLTQSVPPERHRHGIEVIARNARVQLQLIEDVLDTSRIVTGKLRLSLETVNVAHAVTNAIESMRPAADVKGVAIETDLQDVSLVADGARLQQVVWNLVSNAVRFTPAGGRVSVRTHQSAGHVDIVVEDNGIGIAPEFLPFVFDRFSQADASSTRQHGGLGLGLAIVRHLTEMHGGTVWASSAGVGGGATFVVRIPARQPQATSSMLPGTSRARGDPELAGVRVLVVEDDRDTRDVVGESLRMAGAWVSLAQNGVEAEAALAHGPFDVVLSDIAMPGEDGFEVLDRLRRALAPAPMPPAIAFTGYGQAVDRHRALRNGFRDHLVKPVPPEVLVECVRRAAKDAPRAAGGIRSSA